MSGERSGGFAARLCGFKPKSMSNDEFYKKLQITFSHITRWKSGTSPSIRKVEELRNLLSQELHIHTTSAWLGFGELPESMN